MTLKKPSQTAADYLIIGISPVLIMLLVGSLCFFLIEVFFRGEAIDSVRWVMFWFVMAVVLVSRIGIEQGTGQAAVYGLALAAVTWLYLVRIHPAFILGLILLGVVWWCANKLTWDCSLIDDDEDASGSGLLETVSHFKKTTFIKTSESRVPKTKQKAQKKSAAPHPPGLWVVYFSLAALPLFGVGQMLLPRDDATARHMGFTYLFVYVLAAMGLLLTTSFLGLRRYLRQRYLPMPPLIALGWIRFGAGLGIFVLIGALLLPRPGANEAWESLRYHVDYRLHQASDYAMRLSPHGSGHGRPGNDGGKSDTSKNPTATSPQPQPGQGQSPSPGQNGKIQDKGAPSQTPSGGGAGALYNLFKILFLLAIAALAGWWLFRRRELIFQAIKSIIASVTQFFRDLFRLGSTSGATVPAGKKKPNRRPFAAFHNPFLTGREAAWTHGQLILYSYDALRAWAEEKGIVPRPEQTAREFCQELSGQFPEINSELNQLSSLYGRAAYTTSGADGSDLEPVKSLWRFFYV
jgi:Domain of unknown function (DUF4129)